MAVERYQPFELGAAFQVEATLNAPRIVCETPERSFQLTQYEGVFSRLHRTEDLSLLSDAVSRPNGGVELEDNAFKIKSSSISLDTLRHDVAGFTEGRDKAGLECIEALTAIVWAERVHFFENHVAKLNATKERYVGRLWAVLDIGREFDSEHRNSHIARLHGFHGLSDKPGSESIGTIVSGKDGEKRLWSGLASLYIQSEIVSQSA